MCAILDASMFGGFLNLDNEDMQPVRYWIEKNGGKLVYSRTDKLSEELRKSSNMTRWFKRNFGKGKLKFADKTKVTEKEKELQGLASLVSNDYHIIALAQISNVKLLISKDTKLHKDFTNNKFIRQGKIYQDKSHARLLKKDICR